MKINHLKQLIMALILAGNLWLPAMVRSETSNTIQLTEQQINSLGIQLGKMQAVTETPLLTAPATVVIPPEHESIVSTSQAGLITHLTAAVGEHVKKGTLLAKINSPDLLTLQGRYLKALSTLKLAKATYDRDQKLLKEGVIATRREQETLSQYNQSVLEVNETQQLLAIAGLSGTDIKKLAADQRLNSTINVYAPLSGVVVERMVAVGTRIDMQAPLFKLANLSTLWLEINIPQEHVHDINVGDLVNLDNSNAVARISLINQSVHPENQTVLARAVISGAPEDIRPGQRLNIKVVQENNNFTFTVPNTAIAQNEGQFYIFIRTKTGFTVTPITIVGKQAEQTTITGSFNGDEDIAVQGAVALKANWLGLGSEE